MISLRTLSDLGGLKTLAHIFSEEELNREYRCLMPYVDLNFFEGRARISLAVVAYPQVLPKRWPADGRMLGVILDTTATLMDVSYLQASTNMRDVVTDISSAEISPEKLVLTTTTTQFSLDRGGAIVSAVFPMGSSYCGPEHLGKQLGKF